MANCTRRNFLKTGFAAGALMGAGLPLRAARGTATDWVTLGKPSGVEGNARLAFGNPERSVWENAARARAGSVHGRLVRHAYDHGIRFFETSETYGEMHKMLGVALKGIPRDSYRLMSKVTTREGVNPQVKIDELRTLANTDYFDVMLMHFQHAANWPTDTVRWQDRDPGSEVEKDRRGGTARVGAWAPWRCAGSRKQLAGDRDDPGKPHKGTRMDAEVNTTRNRGRERERGGHAREAGPSGKVWA